MNSGLTNENINVYGHYDQLFNSIDGNKAKEYFEKKTGEILTPRKAKILADNVLRKIIIEGL